jgi:hypothetical protein
VRINATREHEPSARIKLVDAGPKARSELSHATITDTHVRSDAVRVGHHRAMTNDEVEHA